MRRGFAVVAWLVATAVSVGVSTAAVGSVRNQVSERPSLVSLAAIREANSTTSVVEAASTVGSAPALNLEISEATSTTTSTTTTTTTTTSAPTVPATQAPATTAPPPPPSGTEPPEEDAEDMPVEQLAVDGGFVKVGLANDSLQLIDALPKDGFRVEMGTWLDAVIEVRFVGRAEVWRVVAELVDGRIRLSDQRTDASGDDRPGEDDGGRGDERKDQRPGGDHPWERDRGGAGDDEGPGEPEGGDDESGDADAAETTSTSTAA